MKRCPECRRDYYDDTLRFCLDDGARLVDGPAINGEPTVILDSAARESRTEWNHDAPTKTFEECESTLLAILPFRNLTGKESVSFYEFSLADAVITDLVRLRSLAVCPSSVVAKYLGLAKDPLDIGKELRASAVLAANFLHENSRIRVTAQLIDVRTGTIIWGERIDADASDIISVQDNIAQHIVDGLQLKFSPSQEIGLSVKATEDPVAYEEYLRGRDRMRRYVYHSLSNEDLESAIEHFKRATALDSKFALAHCGLGSAYLQRVVKGLGSVEDISKAQEALDRGLAFDSQIFEARAYRAYIYTLQNEHAEGHRQISKLRSEAPHNSLVHLFSGVLYRQCGDYENALSSFNEMLRVDPTTKVVVCYSRARVFMYQQRFREAFSELDRARAIEPNHLLVRFFYGVFLFRTGELQNATILFRDLLKSAPRDVLRPYLAMCLSLSGDHQGAREQLTDGVERVASTDADAAYWLASAYLLEDQYDKALEWLRRSIILGNSNHPWLTVNPIWKPLHGNHRFIELMSQIQGRLTI